MYQDFCKDLQTGDLLLFNGTSWFSRIIERFTHSEYSHVAIILKQPLWLDPKLTDDYYILESGPEDFGDAVDNKKKFGVQITSLKELYSEYVLKNSGKLYVRRLVNPNKDIEKNIKKAYDKVKDKPYDVNPLDWLLALIELDKTEEEIDVLKDRKTNTFWCSALVTYVLVCCGFINKDISWSLISPSDYCCYNKKSRISFTNCEYEADKCLL